jgi:hypothetical protein
VLEAIEISFKDAHSKHRDPNVVTEQFVASRITRFVCRSIPQFRATQYFSKDV